MEIIKGFQLETPHIFIPWRINEYSLIGLFKGSKLRHVTNGYYTTTCICLNGLNCELGFHFEPRENGNLTELEFFRTSYEDLKKSFDDFQFHFEKYFGPSTFSREGTEGFTDYMWVFDNIGITHMVTERFGPEEHMRVICK